MGSRSLLCRHHGCELAIPLFPPYRFFNRDYSVFDYGGMAFSEANLKPFVRVYSSLHGEPHLYSAFWRFRSPLLADGNTDIGPKQRSRKLAARTDQMPTYRARRQLD
jgi:hypothetical protein